MTDTERLDWCIDNEAFAIQESKEAGWFIAYVAREPSDGFYPSAREAIDAAAAAPKAGKGDAA